MAKPSLDGMIVPSSLFLLMPNLHLFKICRYRKANERNPGAEEETGTYRKSRESE